MCNLRVIFGVYLTKQMIMEIELTKDILLEEISKSYNNDVDFFVELIDTCTDNYEDMANVALQICRVIGPGEGAYLHLIKDYLNQNTL